MEEIIKVSNLTKCFGDNQVLTDISFQVNKGDVVAVIGFRLWQIHPAALSHRLGEG